MLKFYSLFEQAYIICKIYSRLIESDAATEDALQEVGKLLLNVRTKVNGEITKLIMLR